ncbi:hypothetical protein V6259_18000 [Marinomonas sp. TI.3.20]|uniref:hypothetical protein n=1 Tax=Marinomonas sp. TI.3.20 TaxID=3121296 RepID=UPI00311FCB23
MKIFSFKSYLKHLETITHLAFSREAAEETIANLLQRNPETKVTKIIEREHNDLLVALPAPGGTVHLSVKDSVFIGRSHKLGSQIGFDYFYSWPETQEQAKHKLQERITLIQHGEYPHPL